MDRVLLLTATIKPPPGVPALKRTDPAQRMDDYVRAFRYYLGTLGTTFDRIVFVDNSASDLGPLEALIAGSSMSGRVELLSYFGLDYPSPFGRGYGEFKLVDYAMDNAKFLQGDVVVWKCTGRYIVRNIDRLVRTRPPVDVYCHLRNYPLRLCELFLMSFTRHGFDTVIRGTYRLLRNDAVPGVHTNEEITFRQLVDAWPPGLAVAKRFEDTPLVDGIRGWNDQRYSGKHSPKTLLRRLARVVAPWLWI